MEREELSRMLAAVGVGDDVTFYKCSMDFIATNGQPVHKEVQKVGIKFISKPRKEKRS